ncbi:MAG: hypothetical protein ANABAC_3174 [Anaerolineae bacterium]|nr:MAG: hypothetical protein ANABAC_3174 [Anaerolineae bacterium]
MKKWFFILVAVLWMLSSSCAFLQRALSPTPTDSSSLEATITALSLLLTQPADTATPLPTNTPKPTATPTPDVKATRLAKTATRQANLTQTAQPMAEIVNFLVREGALASANGTFRSFDTFIQSWAKLDWYQYWYQGETKYADFVLSMDIEMMSASDKANWHHAGCGIVFRHVDNDNHLFLIIAQNGRMSLRKRIKDEVYIIRDSTSYGSSVPVEKVHLDMVVQGMEVTLFADGVQILQARDPLLGSTFREGRLAFSVMSGTNKSYGTRCEMNNIWMWVLK